MAKKLRLWMFAPLLVSVAFCQLPETLEGNHFRSCVCQLNCPSQDELGQVETNSEQIGVLRQQLELLQEQLPSWLCPGDFTYDSESKMCIKLFMYRVPWAAAKDSCHSLGRRYRLAVLDTPQKIQFARAFLLESNLRRGSSDPITGWHDQCFLGGHQENDDGRWLWSTGEEITQGWGDGQPSNGGLSGSEDCLAFAWGPDWTTWWFNDSQCSNRDLYICEYYFN